MAHYKVYTRSFASGAIDGAGEANTISSVGAGTSAVKGKSGVDLQVKSFTSQNNRLTLGSTTDTVTLTVNDANIDHDALTNFVPNEHIDHSAVSISVGTGLTGGGDLTANRSIDLDLANINHDGLQNFVANEHVDHSSVSISAGTGLTGGGDITASRTLSLDINGLTAETTAATDDSVAVYDLSATALRKMSLADLLIAPIANNTYFASLDSTAVSRSILGLNSSNNIQLLSPNSIFIRPTTSDTSDNARVVISGGGASEDPTRGGYVAVAGNEHGEAGTITIAAGAVGGGNLNLRTNNALRWQIDNAGVFKPGVNNSFAIGTSSLEVSAVNARVLQSTVGVSIFANTSDGSDNQQINICAGSTSGSTRGARIVANGNEVASTGGRLILAAGNVSGAFVEIETAGTTQFRCDNSGNFSPTVDNSKSIGGSGTNLANVHTRSITSNNTLTITSTDWVSNSTAGYTFQVAGTSYWTLQSTNGRLVPSTTNITDIGTSSLRVREIFTTNVLNVSSDIRDKEDIVNIDIIDSFDKVNKITPIYYRYNFDKADKVRSGFSAQELEPIFAHMVSIDEQGKYSIRPGELIPHLVAAIKHLSERVAALESH